MFLLGFVLSSSEGSFRSCLIRFLKRNQFIFLSFHISTSRAGSSSRAYIMCTNTHSPPRVSSPGVEREGCRGRAERDERERECVCVCVRVSGPSLYKVKKRENIYY